jgi:hypothetical protein
MNVHAALAEVQNLKNLWKQKRFDEYFLLARAFLQEWREQIINAAHHPVPYLGTLRCLQALLVIHHNTITTDESVVAADEDLFLDASARYLPRTRDEGLIHTFTTATISSNIFKRRAFVQLRQNDFGEASSLFQQAADFAENAVTLCSCWPEPAASAMIEPQYSPEELDQRLQGAIKHNQYLRFHGAVTAMRWAEFQGLPDAAENWWRDVKSALAHSDSPENLFDGRGYIWSSKDLDGYVHLIEALRSFLTMQFKDAAQQYEAWLVQVPEYRSHWRFQNVETRKLLAEILCCATQKCPNCVACSTAATNLAAVLNKWGIGRAARELARIGVSLYQFRLSFDLAQQRTILDDAVFPLLPLQISANEITPPASDNYASQLPAYFVDLASELRGLRRMMTSDDVIRAFIWRRLREFVEICAEYELGRAATEVDHSKIDIASLTNVASVVTSLIEARSARKSPHNFGTASWKRIKDQISEAEMDQAPKAALAVYELTTNSMAGYFPAIVRVTARVRAETENTTTGEQLHITSVEQLNGDDFQIKSQFSLSGDFGYLPPRYVRQTLTEALLQNDRSKWVTATKAAAVFVFQTIPVWEGDWNQFKDEFETQFLDFKERLPRVLGKHIAAFANSRGGWLVFGIIDPEHRTSAISRALDLEECSQIVTNVIKASVQDISPPIVPASFFRAYPQDKLAILCRIDRSLMPPHRFDGKIYARIGAESRPINEDAWRELSL